MNVIGIDIGTTTICAVAVNSASGEIIETAAKDNDTFIPSQNAWKKLQQPEKIIAMAMKLIEEMCQRHFPVKYIGITGQMHGILYVDDSGNAVSPLYTWQDGRGDLIYKDGKSYSEYITAQTGYKCAAGYGSVTHFYNMINNEVPENASSFCTIYDYLAMKLTGNQKLVTDCSSAASLGLYDLKNNCFDSGAISVLGLNKNMFPKVVQSCSIIGKAMGGISVISAIGDNQASFIGSVKAAENSILVNVGTGSQITLTTDSCNANGLMETRPYINNSYLLVGSALCGGRAYELLRGFFNAVLEKAGNNKAISYGIMNNMAESAMLSENKLTFNTAFGGTRLTPSKRASIEQLSIDNFRPEYFCLGVLEGIVNELYEMYKSIDYKFKPKYLIGSGNGIRKNRVLQKLFEQRFEMEMKIPAHEEEAAFGAALTALAGAGAFGSIRDVQNFIKYK